MRFWSSRHGCFPGGSFDELLQGESLASWFCLDWREKVSAKNAFTPRAVSFQPMSIFQYRRKKVFPALAGGGADKGEH